MSQASERIALREIKLEGFSYSRILSLQIEEEAGQHGICHVDAVIPQALKSSELLSMGQQKKITLKSPQGGIIFCGMMVRIIQEDREDVHLLRVVAQTLSCQLDRTRKSRTFQSPDKTLKKVLSDVASNSGCSSPDIKGGDAEQEKISQMLYQDQQTDWEFLHRLAESMGRFLFVDGKTDALRVSVGPVPFKGGKQGDALLELGRHLPVECCECIQKNTYSKARTAYFIETDILTNDLGIGVGYSFTYDNKAQIVKKSRIVTEHSTLVNQVTLVPKEGCRVDARAELREANRGKYLAGKVLEAQGKDKSGSKRDDCVKVQFDCDKSQDKKDARWIPYRNVVNNYMYSMPDEGDRVSVYFEENGTILAIGSLRGTDRSAQSRLQDCKPENRSFLSADQFMEFQSKELSFVAGKKAQSAYLKESTDKGISLKAKKDVVIKSDSDIVMQASAGQTMSKQTQMAATHMVGFGMYTACAGQPPSTMLNPMGGMIGKNASSLKSSGASEEKVQISDLAKELDKKSGAKAQEQKKSSGGGSGGSGKLKIKAGSTLLLKVGDSSIEVSKGNIKTKVLFTAAYIPGPGVGSGAPAAIGPGKPQNRSTSIKAEHGAEDRSRLKEGGRGVNDNKRISKSG